MKIFWRYNILLSILLMIIFAMFLYFGFKNDNILYLSFAKYIVLITLIQLIISVIFSIIQYKRQSLWTILYILIIGLISFFEVILYFGVLSGLMGDSSSIGS